MSRRAFWLACPHRHSRPKQKKYRLRKNPQRRRFHFQHRHSSSSVLHFRDARYHRTSQSPLIPITKGAPQFLPPGIRLSGEQASYQSDRHSYSCIATAMKANTHEILIIDFARRLTLAGRSVSSMCLLRQVSSALSRNCRNEPRPDVGEAWFVAANLWQRNCMDTVT